MRVIEISEGGELSSEGNLKDQTEVRSTQPRVGLHSRYQTERRDWEETSIVAKRLCLTDSQVQRGVLTESLADEL